MTKEINQFELYSTDFIADLVKAIIPKEERSFRIYDSNVYAQLFGGEKNKALSIGIRKWLTKKADKPFYMIFNIEGVHWITTCLKKTGDSNFNFIYFDPKGLPPEKTFVDSFFRHHVFLKAQELGITNPLAQITYSNTAFQSAQDGINCGPLCVLIIEALHADPDIITYIKTKFDFERNNYDFYSPNFLADLRKYHQEAIAQSQNKKRPNSDDPDSNKREKYSSDREEDVFRAENGDYLMAVERALGNTNAGINFQHHLCKTSNSDYSAIITNWIENIIVGNLCITFAVSDHNWTSFVIKLNADNDGFIIFYCDSLGKKLPDSIERDIMQIFSDKNSSYKIVDIGQANALIPEKNFLSSKLLSILIFEIVCNSNVQSREDVLFYIVQHLFKDPKLNIAEMLSKKYNYFLLGQEAVPFHAQESGHLYLPDLDLPVLDLPQQIPQDYDRIRANYFALTMLNIDFLARSFIENIACIKNYKGSGLPIDRQIQLGQIRYSDTENKAKIDNSGFSDSVVHFLNDPSRENFSLVLCLIEVNREKECIEKQKEISSHWIAINFKKFPTSTPLRIEVGITDSLMDNNGAKPHYYGLIRKIIRQASSEVYVTNFAHELYIQLLDCDKQKFDTCGYRAVYNAVTMLTSETILYNSDLLRNLLNGDNINQFIRAYRPILVQEFGLENGVPHDNIFYEDDTYYLHLQHLNLIGKAGDVNKQIHYLLQQSKNDADKYKGPLIKEIKNFKDSIATRIEMNIRYFNDLNFAYYERIINNIAVLLQHQNKEDYYLNEADKIIAEISNAIGYFPQQNPERNVDLITAIVYGKITPEQKEALDSIKTSIQNIKENKEAYIKAIETMIAATSQDKQTVLETLKYIISSEIINVGENISEKIAVSELPSLHNDNPEYINKTVEKISSKLEKFINQDNPENNPVIKHGQIILARNYLTGKKIAYEKDENYIGQANFIADKIITNLILLGFDIDQIIKMIYLDSYNPEKRIIAEYGPIELYSLFTKFPLETLRSIANMMDKKGLTVIQDLGNFLDFIAKFISGADKNLQDLNQEERKSAIVLFSSIAHMMEQRGMPEDAELEAIFNLIAQFTGGADKNFINLNEEERKSAIVLFSSIAHMMENKGMPKNAALEANFNLIAQFTGGADKDFRTLNEEERKSAIVLFNSIANMMKNRGIPEDAALKAIFNLIAKFTGGAAKDFRTLNEEERKSAIVLFNSIAHMMENRGIQIIDDLENNFNIIAKLIGGANQDFRTLNEEERKSTIKLFNYISQNIKLKLSIRPTKIENILNIVSNFVSNKKGPQDLDQEEKKLVITLINYMIPIISTKQIPSQYISDAKRLQYTTNLRILLKNILKLISGKDDSAYTELEEEQKKSAFLLIENISDLYRQNKVKTTIPQLINTIDEVASEKTIDFEKLDPEILMCAQIVKNSRERRRPATTIENRQAAAAASQQQGMARMA